MMPPHQNLLAGFSSQDSHWKPQHAPAFSSGLQTPWNHPWLNAPNLRRPSSRCAPLLLSLIHI